MRYKPENMLKAAERGYILATDIADYLVKKGEAFRSAHEVVGKLVSYAIEKKKALAELSLQEYKSFSPLFGKDVFTVTLESSVAARNVIGGTAPARVAEALVKAKEAVESL